MDVQQVWIGGFGLVCTPGVFWLLSSRLLELNGAKFQNVYVNLRCKFAANFSWSEKSQSQNRKFLFRIVPFLSNLSNSQKE